MPYVGVRLDEYENLLGADGYSCCSGCSGHSWSLRKFRRVKARQSAIADHLG